MQIRALTWNLFHGRDFPPDPALLTLRSRLFGVSEANDRHVQVNRPLRREFRDVLAALEWDVALLQEAPPRWLGHFCRELGASGASALTARYVGHALRAFLAERNPDLMASGGGGSNQLLVRPPWRIEEVRRHTFTRRPERRRLVWARLAGPRGASLAVANLHASTSRARAAADVLDSARRVAEWSRELPLVFGGDLNVRPGETSELFTQLARGYGLAGSTAPDAIDHLLARGLEIEQRPHRLPDDVREVADDDGRLVRLSDHACVAARWRIRVSKGDLTAPTGAAWDSSGSS
jgi:hypothetical protein